MSGTRRAAVALVALGPERGAAVLAGMTDAHARQLAAAVADLGPVTADEARQALAALSDGLSAGPSDVLKAPGKDYAKDLLVRGLGDRGHQAALELDAPAPFSWLTALDPDVAARALARQPRGAAALALAHVEPRAAAGLLTRLPEEVRSRVAGRVAGLGTVHPATLALVESALREDTASSSSGDTATVRKVEGPSLLAGVLARAGRETGKAVLAALELESPELAAATRDALFTFDDVCELEARTLQVLLRAVDGRTLALSLVGIDEHVADRLLENLSERARTSVLEEQDVLQGSKPADIATARGAVVAAARRLEEEGAIELRAAEEEAA